ncbi:hypothetical protein G5B40_18510 [Pikeienuella piscinae]|uniref:Uncharacterized protein n=1 Tax=Pikeienuella piscinae TaxID=2748098 RepID=A0A7M3T5H7_9RHOB|nr:hypothetical protein [Pikeienuella piscinae]QIE57258.1 hypothetical protein G5B40_18510 [Pikeienuella piscinae]
MTDDLSWPDGEERSGMSGAEGDRKRTETVRAAPKAMSAGLWPGIAGRPGRTGAPDAFLAHVAAAEGARIATRRTIGAGFAARVPAGS